jgi:hypothetical protein
MWIQNAQPWNSLLLHLILVMMQVEVELPLLPIHTRSAEQASCSIFVDGDEDGMDMY